MKRLLVPAALLAVAAIFFAACGGSDDGGESSGRASASRDTATTVSTERIDGKTVLVDADGKALYTSEQEAGGVVKCTTGACLEFWEPLTIEGGQPTGSVTGGALGVLTRPDGKTQVTFNGDPVYSFTEDQSGSVTGDGLTDAFDGQEFTWHVVTTGDQPSTPPSTSGSGGGIPGY
jgi:predicted lipoprotein with Yx(FWY)xxD motif